MQLLKAEPPTSDVAFGKIHVSRELQLAKALVPIAVTVSLLTYVIVLDII